MVRPNENEYVRFFILVIGFIALAMIAQMEETQNTPLVVEASNSTTSSLVSLVRPLK